MHKSFKRLISLTLAGAMVFSIALTAAAAGKNDNAWGDWRYYSTWGNWNKSDDESSIMKTLSSDPVSYYMQKRSDTNEEMAKKFYMAKSYIPTTIPGVYAVNTVPVAVRTPAYELLNKYDIPEGSGLMARFYDLPSRSVHAKAAIDGKAAELGAAIGAYMDISLAKVDSTGKLTELPKSDSEFKVQVGIPASIRGDNMQYAAIRVRSGNVVDVLGDTFEDTTTLTFWTTPNPASYGIIALPMGASVSAPKAAAPSTPAVTTGANLGGLLGDMDAASQVFISTLTPEQLALLVQIGAKGNMSDDAMLSDPVVLAFISSLTPEQLQMIVAIGLGAPAAPATPVVVTTPQI